MLDVDLNPLDILGARRFDYLPPHLTPVAVVTKFWHPESIAEWIEKNLKGRYYFGQLTKLDDNRIVNYYAVAFEDSFESTIFLLKCPFIGQN